MQTTAEDISETLSKYHALLKKLEPYPEWHSKVVEEVGKWFHLMHNNMAESPIKRNLFEKLVLLPLSRTDKNISCDHAYQQLSFHIYQSLCYITTSQTNLHEFALLERLTTLISRQRIANHRQVTLTKVVTAQVNLLQRVRTLQVKTNLTHRHRRQQVSLDVQHLQVCIECQVLEKFSPSLIINRIQLQTQKLQSRVQFQSLSQISRTIKPNCVVSKIEMSHHLVFNQKLR